MSHRSDPELLVALALRLKGFGEVEAISSVHALEDTVTEDALLKMINANKCVVRQVEGVDKYVLTPTGREEGEELLTTELETSGARDIVQGA